MRITTARGQPALLTYCANVHPGEGLADVLAMLTRFAGPVRRRLGVDAMGIGLWLSRAALTELRARGVPRLQEALAREGLFVFTLNGFPYGNFQAAVVKRRVYHPDAGTDARREYLLELAETLAALLPDGIESGTISTLPLGHRDEAAPDLEARAVGQLCALARDLGRLHQRTGKSIRVCLEPEPGCLLETTADAIRFFTDVLPAAAARAGTGAEVWRAHLGLCFDACHQAVAFEDPARALSALRAAGVVVGKAQLSSALVVRAPGSAAARKLLAAFDEPRFLHQVRARLDDGRLAGVDDLSATGALPEDRPWRVHFHVPVLRELVGELGTTRDFLGDVLAALQGWDPVPHLEVETYTWSVLPEADRPRDDAGLIEGIAAELRWVLQEVA
jgi:sugar phosphate isomerase/epimerase